MTITTLVTMYDNASKSYDAPRSFPSKGVALRSVIDLVNDPNLDKPNTFRDHSEHYSLFVVGDFDTETCTISLLKNPELVANLWELKK